MSDPRVKLVSKIDGTHELHITDDNLAGLGPEGLAKELDARGFPPSDLGAPIHRPHRRLWVIPILRTDE